MGCIKNLKITAPYVESSDIEDRTPEEQSPAETGRKPRGTSIYIAKGEQIPPEEEAIPSDQRDKEARSGSAPKKRGKKASQKGPGGSALQRNTPCPRQGQKASC